MTHRTPRREGGTATTEYAVGTIGACSIALVLLHLVDDVWFLGSLQELFGQGFDQLPGFPRRIGGVVR